MLDRQKFHDAREFARKVHQDQKYGDQPYFVHLEEVVVILHTSGFEENTDVLATGFLHDVLEDTKTTALDLTSAGFSSDVVGAVEFCTDEPGQTRRERKVDTCVRALRDIRAWEKSSGGLFTRVPSSVAIGLIVKAADRLANMRASQRSSPSRLKMYQAEFKTFRDVYYVAGACDLIWKELHAAAEVVFSHAVGPEVAVYVPQTQWDEMRKASAEGLRSSSKPAQCSRCGYEVPLLRFVGSRWLCPDCVGVA